MILLNLILNIIFHINIYLNYHSKIKTKRNFSTFKLYPFKLQKCFIHTNKIERINREKMKRFVKRWKMFTCVIILHYMIHFLHYHYVLLSFLYYPLVFSTMEYYMWNIIRRVFIFFFYNTFHQYFLIFFLCSDFFENWMNAKFYEKLKKRWRKLTKYFLYIIFIYYIFIILYYIFILFYSYI